MPSDLSQVLKGKTPVGYLRVSTSEQKSKGSGLKSQKTEILRFLKANGIRKQPIWFEEQVSGGKAKRKEFDKMKQFILDQKKPSDFFCVLRDFKRWSRHTIYGPSEARQFYDNGIEIVSAVTSHATGHSRRADADGEFMFGLWQALGGKERTEHQAVVDTGVALGQTLGRIGGAPLDSDQPWETVVENWWRFELPKGAPEKLGYKKAAKDWKVTNGWVRGALKRFQAFQNWMVLNDMDVKKGLNEWLDVMERLRKIRRVYGKGSDIFKAAQANTSGILKKPWLYWALKEQVGSEKAFAEYVDNPEPFLAK